MRTKIYEDLINRRGQENKPNSKPIDLDSRFRGNDRRATASGIEKCETKPIVLDSRLRGNDRAGTENFYRMGERWRVKIVDSVGFGGYGISEIEHLVLLVFHNFLMVLLL